MNITHLPTLTEVSQWVAAKKVDLVVQQFKSDHKARFEFYTLLHDYLSSPGQVSPIDFFGWYLNQLDKEMHKEPEIVRHWRRFSRTSNRPVLRTMLEDCRNKVRTVSADFAGAVTDWLPDDEGRILTVAITSDIREQLQTAMAICQEKISAAKLMSNAVSSNAILFIMMIIVHYVIYDFLYRSFITSPAIIEPDFAAERLSEIDKAFLIYHWFTLPTSWGLIALSAFGLYAGTRFLIRNWTTKFAHFREQYVDFLPPFSIAKLSTQYEIVMITNAFMKIGYGFYDAVAECKAGASPYAKKQIDKILDNKSEQAHKAFNTFYMGSFGNMLESRSENIPFEDALASLLPKLSEIRKEKFNRILSLTLLLTVKPLLIGSAIVAIMPIVMHMANIIQALSDSANAL